MKLNNKNCLIICILFGWSGIQHFLLKDYKKGLLYLLTFGLFYIGWIYDIYLAYNWQIKNINSFNNIKNSNTMDYNGKFKVVNGYYNKKGKYIKSYRRTK